MKISYSDSLRKLEKIRIALFISLLSRRYVCFVGNGFLYFSPMVHIRNLGLMEGFNANRKAWLLKLKIILSRAILHSSETHFGHNWSQT